MGRRRRGRDGGDRQSRHGRGRSPRSPTARRRTSIAPSAAAKSAFPEWLETTPGERAGMLLQLADALEANADELCRAESVNVGKPMGIVVDEIPVAADNLRFFAGAARNLEGKAAGEYMRGYTSMIRREPVGVVGQISPWNYPLMMGIWKIGPALAAGNTIVLKPSEQTPLTTLMLAGYIAEIFPAGVVNVITGDGEPVGAGIVRHPGRAHGLADGRRRHRQGDRQGGGRDAEARPPRARRQGAGRRLRRRRPGRRGRGHPDRRLLELRPGLHRGLAHRRRARRSTTSSSRSSSRRSSPSRSATRPRATTSRWAP